MQKNPKIIKQGIILSIVLVFLLRLIHFLAGYSFIIRFNNLPVTKREMDLTEIIYSDKSNKLFTLLQPIDRFDALWYKDIAIEGYKNHPLSTAFFPLYPWLVQGMSNITGQVYELCSFILTTVLTILVFYLLFVLTYLEYDTEAARRVLLLYAFFPTSFFLLMPYSESLLIFLILLTFYLVRKKLFILGVVSASLAVLTKPYGILTAIPLILYISNIKSLTHKIYSSLFLLLLPLSFLGIYYYQFQETAGKYTILNIHKYWGIERPYPWQPITSLFTRFYLNPFDLPNTGNFFLILGTVFFLIKSYKKIGVPFWLFSLFAFLTFYFFQYRNSIIFSYSRYFLAFFPIFMYYGSKKIKDTQLNIYLPIAFSFQLLFFIFYTFGFFVA